MCSSFSWGAERGGWHGCLASPGAISRNPTVTTLTVSESIIIITRVIGLWMHNHKCCTVNNTEYIISRQYNVQRIQHHTQGSGRWAEDQCTTAGERFVIMCGDYGKLRSTSWG